MKLKESKLGIKEKLNQISKRYDYVVDQMIRCAKEKNNEEHDKWIKEERKLENQGIKIRRLLGIYDFNPCLLVKGAHSQDCNSCSGVLYTDEKGVLKVAIPNIKMKNSFVCQVKQWMKEEYTEED
jgi:hypothetical protein